MITGEIAPRLVVASEAAGIGKSSPYAGIAQPVALTSGEVLLAAKLAAQANRQAPARGNNPTAPPPRSQTDTDWEILQRASALRRAQGDGKRRDEQRSALLHATPLGRRLLAQKARTEAAPAPPTEPSARRADDEKAARRAALLAATPLGRRVAALKEGKS